MYTTVLIFSYAGNVYVAYLDFGSLTLQVAQENCVKIGNQNVYSVEAWKVLHSLQNTK